MPKILIEIEAKQKEWLEKQKETRGVPMATYIRWAITQYMNTPEQKRYPKTSRK